MPQPARRSSSSIPSPPSPTGAVHGGLESNSPAMIQWHDPRYAWRHSSGRPLSTLGPSRLPPSNAFWSTSSRRRWRADRRDAACHATGLLSHRSGIDIPEDASVSCSVTPASLRLPKSAFSANSPGQVAAWRSRRECSPAVPLCPAWRYSHCGSLNARRRGCEGRGGATSRRGTIKQTRPRHQNGRRRRIIRQQNYRSLDVRRHPSPWSVIWRASCEAIASGCPKTDIK